MARLAGVGWPRESSSCLCGISHVPQMHLATRACGIREHEVNLERRVGSAGQSGRRAGPRLTAGSRRQQSRLCAASAAAVLCRSGRGICRGIRHMTGIRVSADISRYRADTRRQLPAQIIRRYLGQHAVRYRVNRRQRLSKCCRLISSRAMAGRIPRYLPICTHC